MRRYTLAKLCWGILALLFLALLLRGTPPSPLPKGGRRIAASGRVTQIAERRTQYGAAGFTLSLTAVTFCDGDLPIESVNTKEKEKIEVRYAKGALCYLEEEEAGGLPRIGERIVISGWAEDFEGKKNPGGFDAAAYYRAKGLAFCVRGAKILRRSGTYSAFGQGLFALSRFLASVLDTVCGEDAPVMKAMLLGDKSGLSDEIKEWYRLGGISHILAISGLHVSFLGMGLYRILKRLYLPRPLAGALTAGVLASYTAMSGASPSACRAALMFSGVLLAEALGRSYERLTMLSVSALLSALIRPELLTQSAFLLSYGAVLGLTVFLPVLSRLFTGRILQGFLAGVSVSAFTLPALLCSFSSFPLCSLFLNLLVIPLMGALMALGVLSLAAGAFCPAAGRLLFYPAHGILLAFQGACRITAAVPGNEWIVGEPSWVQIALYYVLLLFLCLMGRYATKPCALLTLAGALCILSRPFYTGVTITAFDVGQGDACLIQSEGTAVLIDGGSSSERRPGQEILLPALRAQGVRRLDYVFLTHTDADHINGVEELLTMDPRRRPAIKTLVLPSLTEPDDVYLRLARRAKEAGIRVCVMKRGDTLTAGGLSFLCLHPEAGGAYEDKNAASLVLYLQSGGFSALFTGDLDGEAEEAFAESYPAALRETVFLKAGHHGSKASCGEALLSRLAPEIAVISCAEKNSYGHPAKETLSRLARAGSRVYVTKDTGAVRVRWRRERARVFCCLREAGESPLTKLLESD